MDDTEGHANNQGLLIDDLVRLGILAHRLINESALEQIQRDAVRINSFVQLDAVFDIETIFYLTSFGLGLLQACTAPEDHKTVDG